MATNGVFVRLLRPRSTIISRHIQQQLRYNFFPRFSSTDSRNKKVLSKFKNKIPHSLIDNDYIYEHQPSQDSLKDVMDDVKETIHDVTSNVRQDLKTEKTIYSRLKPITPNDQYVSCTIFDKNGNVTAVSKKYPKMQFLKDNDLFPRDFRKIDTSSIDVAPSIMVRPNAILVNLLHIKAIIKKDSVMVFDTSTPEVAAKLGLFMYDLEMKLKLPSSLCYEFRALESIFISIMSFLETDMKTHLSSCGRILSELEDQVDRNRLQDLLIRLKKLSSFYQKGLLIRDVLEEVLDNDEDLAGMYLTLPKNFDPETEDYEDLEMILESYYNQCDEFVQQAGSLINDIRATEEIVNIILDANRNSLMLFELKVTIYTLGFTVATLIPAFYGMNLRNYIEESHFGFGAILVASIIQGLIITFISFKKLHKVQKLTMMSSNQVPRRMHHLSSPIGTLTKNKWYYRLFFGTPRNTTYHRPTTKEKAVIWRMINDDKPMK